MIKVFSMFSGLGGFEQGIKLSKIQHEMIGFCEINKFAVDVYKKHFKGVKHYEDATTINTGALPDFDLLVAGFPCQAFSVAGLGKGEMDTRGTLYHEILRVLRDKRPRYFVLENVKGLLSHRHRQTFITIIKGLSDLGYRVEWTLCNSKNTGLPQNRERVYITGYLGSRCGRGVLSLGANTKKDSRRVGVELSYCLDANYGKSTNTILKGRRQLAIVQVNQPKHSNDRVYAISGIAPTLNTMQGGRRAPFVLLESARVRMLTPLECERVQGLPDGWTQVGHSGKTISKTQRYKMIGNSVSPQVVRDIIIGLMGGNINV